MSGLMLGLKEAAEYAVIDTDVVSSGDQAGAPAPIEILQVDRIQDSYRCAERCDITGPDWQTLTAQFMSELNKPFDNRLVRHRLRVT